MAERIRAIDIVNSKKVAHRKRDLEVPKHGGGRRELDQRNYFGERKFAAVITLVEGVRRQIRHFPANGQKPAHDHVKHMGIDIHLRDGLTPDPQSGEIRGLVEVKVREIRPNHGGGKTNYYLYLNVYPLPEGQAPVRQLEFAQYFRDENAYETIFVPNADQDKKQASIGIRLLDQPAARAASAST